jgi:hypothetical protein
LSAIRTLRTRTPIPEKGYKLDRDRISRLAARC